MSFLYLILCYQACLGGDCLNSSGNPTVPEGTPARETPKDNRESVKDLALYATMLLLPEYFDKFDEAIHTSGAEGKKKFEAVCDEAKIPPDIAARLYNGITRGFVERAPWL